MKDRSKLKNIFKLFTTFFRIGAFTFGGGYAMIPLIQREVVDNHKWLTEDDILEIIVISESTPGPIAINSATFVGYRTAGIFGAAAATFGVVLPSFLLISLIALVLTEFKDIKLVQYAFGGIRAGVLALLVKALHKMYQKAPKGIFGYMIMGIAFFVSAFTGINVLFVILFCALAGILYSYFIIPKSKGGKS